MRLSAAWLPHELEKFERDRREIYIYDLAVAEEHRRKGLATSLLKELQRIAKARNVYVLFVQATLKMTPPSGSTNHSEKRVPLPL